MKCDVHGVEGCTSRGCAICLNKDPEDPDDARLINMLGRLGRSRRHPGDFDGYPTDEQMEYFKRGGR